MEDNKLTVPNTYIKKDTLDPRYLQCPYCLEIQKGSEQVGKGGTHHLHLFCQLPRIKYAREKLLDLIEDSCMSFVDEVEKTLDITRTNEALRELTVVLQTLELGIGS